MLKKYNDKIQSFPLSKKIFLIVLTSVSILFISVLAAFFLLMYSSNRLLHKTVADSLSSSASKISDELENMDAMSASIVLDSTIQQYLTTVKDTPEQITSTTYSTLYNSLESYFQQFRYNHLSYMMLQNTEFLSKTYMRSSQKLPNIVINDLVEKSKNNNGRAVWVTDYNSRYGLFLVREVRRISNASLDTLGTLIINIDTLSLLNNSSRFQSQYGDSSYVLAQGASPIEYSDGLTSDDIRYLQRHLTDSFGIVSLSEGKYFVVRNTIPNFNWDFYSLVPYGSVYNSILLAQIMFFAALFFSIIAAMGLSSYFIRTITIHIDNLIKKIRIFGENDASLPVADNTFDYSNRNDELGLIHQNFDQMTMQIHQLIHVNYQNELLRKDAQIKALETQINPHFLYNTLESINWRAKSSGETEISLMVESLGYLLRAALSQKSKTFSIRQELEFVNCYLTIQKIRFDEQLDFSMDAEEALLDIQIPKLIIQPLVENAIHYALEQIMEECIIEIRISREQEQIEIDVRNSGSQFEENLLNKLKDERVKPNGFGIGLLNIDQRLELTYGEQYGLKLFNEGEFAIARIILPYTTEEGEI